MKKNVSDRLIASASRHYSKKLSASQRTFLAEYYHRLPEDDFSPESTEELIVAALGHREFASIRMPDETLVGITNIESSLTDPEPCTVVNIVTEDSPFLVDSLTILLNNQNFTIYRTIHPLFQVRRSRAHRITAITRSPSVEEELKMNAESFIQFHIDYLPVEEHDALKQDILNTVNEVRTVVADWSPIREQLLSLAVQLEGSRYVDPEYSRLLRWLENHHFAMLGYCEFNLSGTVEKPVVRVDKSTALGFLRVLGQKSSQTIREFLPPLSPGMEKPVAITKTRQRSTIHRAAFMDCILVSQPRGKGKRIHCILGLFSAAAYVRPTSEVPLLRDKTEWILQNSTLRKGSYAYKALRMVVENLPRESLFQIDRKDLFQLSMDILNHQERRKTSVYINQDQCGHFYSCLIYIPRDLYHSDLRLKIEAYLSEVLDGGEVLFDVYFSDSILTRIHYIVHTRSGKPVDHDPEAIEREIQNMARDWNDSLRVKLAERYDLKRARELMLDYADAYSHAYRDDFDINEAVQDISNIEACVDFPFNSMLYAGQRDARQSTRLKVYSIGQAVPLSDILPILENLGLRVLGERPYRVRRQQQEDVWIHDFEIVGVDGQQLDIESDGENLRETLFRTWKGEVENDGFNQLVLGTGLNWRELMVLRACFRYLRQVRLRYSQEYVVNALKANRPIVVVLVQLFRQRFDPQLKRTHTETEEVLINNLLEDVVSLDEDRILRAMFDVILAMLRTNYFQPDAQGESKPYLSFKIDSGAVPRLPEPRPKFEIFVYSPRVEGIHLRGGNVARGGLRWSDRLEDYRTEVLGLVKAQMVKNAVIVPVGSKGGFVPRQLPEGDRESIQKEVIACYSIFIEGLLDLTDNLIANDIVPPAHVVRHDSDDPYLVVAADKGTATFSDIANGISESRNFWLGDAFASGGSMGYDHKKMGITARGAWESVKRLFRERGKDIQNTDFTVLGIGDMAGDVFGNGMLLSKHIRLQAAFNHMHIFIDPDPDAAASYQERKRLFELPRSSWADYQQALISRGGGIFERSAKSIRLSPEIQEMLDTSVAECSPTELINLILKMPVELLWNGGIGTYVKASSETQEAAQDKANDMLRVDARELRCAVIGEGGNLGMTQRARIEFCLQGGLCNTDAIDNSAGVDTSDHEVNIKILFNRAIEDKKLSRDQRNTLLAEMEDEVAALVLVNNYTQTQTISVDRLFGEELMTWHINALRVLEKRGLNRSIEFLPDDLELKKRQEQGESLTRPELAVLLSYSKMDVYQALLDSSLPDDAALSGEIEAYFPSGMREQYRDYIHSHRLKREIIATHLTNRFVGQMGPALHLGLGILTRAETSDIVRAWFIVQEVLQGGKLIEDIEALDNRVTARLQLECLYLIREMLFRSMVWLLGRYASELDILKVIRDYRSLVEQVSGQLDSYLSTADVERLTQRAATLREEGVPEKLAADLSRLDYRAAALEVSGISLGTGQAVEISAAVYFKIFDKLSLGWMLESIEQLAANNQWHERARFDLGLELMNHHSAISRQILSKEGDDHADARVEAWMADNISQVAEVRKLVYQLKGRDSPDFQMLSVLISGLSRLARHE